MIDLLVVGGGINGAGIARDAAGRGLTTILCEKDDLAAHTSSASTKLIHGGLRYLEHFEFSMVRKGLIEREILLRAAPHLIWPLRFIMPHDRGLRPAWLIRAGLLLYDGLSRRQLLGRSHAVDLRSHIAGVVLQPQFKRGFSYADGWVDDARLVVINARDAADHGARILTRTTCAALQRFAGHWRAHLRRHDGGDEIVEARCVVNATGPWAAQFQTTIVGLGSAPPMRLIKGSHIVVRKLFAHDSAYLFQHADGRIVFAIPYEADFTLIGTTDVELDGGVDEVAVSPAEVGYLCDAVNRYFCAKLSPADVVWSYAGVRPLQQDAHGAAAAVTRDYSLQLDVDGAPLLAVYGGKLTTYRRLAEESLAMLAPLLGNRHGPWTADACLPGGDLYGAVPSNRAVLEFDAWVTTVQAHYPWLPPVLMQRYARAYGTRLHRLLAGCGKLADLGDEIVPGMHAREITYLRTTEWAQTATDILWRRSKRGLHLPAEASATLAAWLLQHPEMTP